MNIALLNERIVIQKNEVVVDEYGNHSNAWTDYYTCHATVGGTSENAQKEAAGQTVDDSNISFTVRFCIKTANVDITGYRVVFRGEVYDIVAVDPMNFKKTSIKFKCKKVRR
jgi:SPP1 family predicted phage head-tail adaptor